MNDLVSSRYLRLQYPFGGLSPNLDRFLLCLRFRSFFSWVSAFGKLLLVGYVKSKCGTAQGDSLNETLSCAVLAWCVGLVALSVRTW